MNLKATISLSIAAALFAIGVHQSYYFGIAQSYFIFMFSMGFLFMVKLLNKPKEDTPNAKPVHSTAIKSGTKQSPKKRK